MTNQIVQVNVSLQVASAPSMLQQTGAMISQGGTTLPAGSVQLITQKADLTALLRPALTVVSLTWASSVVTVQTAAGHGIPAGETILGTLAGQSPAGYSGTFACTYVDATHFTYPLVANPGTETVPGTFQLASVGELTAMGNSFFAQGASQAVYVLEFGPGTPANGVTALTAYLANPSPTRFYSYLIPSEWDTEATAPSLFVQYENTTSAVYFYVTTTMATYSTWTAMPIKSVALYLQSPDAPVTEFTTAGAWFQTLSYDPGPVNLVAPLAFKFVFGLTPYKTLTPTQIATIKPLGVNWIGTGAEGGISNTLIVNGKMGDVKPFGYWYAVDWMIINSDLRLSAAVINGSNNPVAPLYFNQAGINSLQKVEQSVVNDAITFGMVLAPVTVTAIPFTTYVAENPSDYAIGKYAGLAVAFVPSRGFEQIVLNLIASDIVT